MTLRIYVRIRPRLRRLIERLDLVDYKVDLDVTVPDLLYTDDVRPAVGMGHVGDLGTIRVRTPADPANRADLGRQKTENHSR